ncbi:oxidoreductase domain-containing protein [Didymella exigua CBS 183.55]|uniref:Oxidoreductase domain-containing protein n=1 Tax=Didymella exigua CBS 183.55 TaxID=1150837 RepID=A0A6A5R6K0_9PLEO|nr:oxidoreductase domain-containing protein [Didymella exigua CBS 183.55]KAF1923203.1 oxidoreductase domain-containing protein [Didymella exigua CBS 183.55]
MTSTHRAAVLPTPGQPLAIKDVETPRPGPNEALIRNHAIAIQPLDAKILISNYGPAASLSFPATLGSSGAGVIEEVGSSVTNVQVGDRVVFDTKAYVDPKVNKQQGTWQQLVISSADTIAKIDDTPFEQAVLTSFPLQTAVAALQVFLGMSRPSPRTAPNQPASDEKVLIWGAGGAVGQHAVQYAASLGYTVTATASPRSLPSLTSLGASIVLDYRSPTILAEIRAHGPFAYLFTASGDASSQRALIGLLSPTGGRFASVLPLSEEVELPANVEIVYKSFSQATHKPEYAEWRNWWYGIYLPSVLSARLESLVAYPKIGNGLSALQRASQEVSDGKVRGKVIVNPQE